MSANVGLSTPRGSGTSGYVQRNLASIRHREQPYHQKKPEPIKHRQKQPDKDILDHDRKRQIEVKVFELRDKLEEDEIDEDEIEARCGALRQELEDEQTTRSAKGLKSHQIHELAEAKIQESEKLRRALGISKDYEEGGHWRRQEQHKLDAEKRFGEVKDGEGEGERAYD